MKADEFDRLCSMISCMSYEFRPDHFYEALRERHAAPRVFRENWGSSRWLRFCVWWPLKSSRNIPRDGVFQWGGRLSGVYCDLHPRFRVRPADVSQRRLHLKADVAQDLSAVSPRTWVESQEVRLSILLKGNPIRLHALKSLYTDTENYAHKAR